LWSSIDEAFAFTAALQRLLLLLLLLLLLAWLETSLLRF
jgi:hypothetical protein